MKQIALILLLFVRMAYAFPADLILDHMSKLCLKPQTFNNAMVTSDKEFFATLELNQSGLFITKEKPVLSEGFTKKNEQLDIFILAQFLSCKPGSAALKQYLSDIGVDQTKVTYGLLNNEPVFIIGAGPTDSLSPQLWVLKATFLPVKEISQGRTAIFRWIDKRFPSLIETEVGAKVNIALPAQAP